jgi:acetoin utilization deacetylase AcuC-like enzyme
VLLIKTLTLFVCCCHRTLIRDAFEAVVAEFKPTVVLVSFGSDASRFDSFHGLSPRFFYTFGKLLATLNTPMIIANEGGYGVKVPSYVNSTNHDNVGSSSTAASVTCGVVES